MSVCLTCQKIRKVALLITNRKYVKKPLTNGHENSTEFAKQLSSMGFVCSVYRDLEIADMQLAFRTFIAGLQDNDMIVIYFTGHSKYIVDSLYNTSITPGCRISMANIFQCIRAQISRGTVLYMGDTCSSDKRNCHYGHCIPRDQKWYDKYAERDKYIITDHYGKTPQKRMTTNVTFTTLLSSEPGTATFAVGTDELFDHTAAIITYINPSVGEHVYPGQTYSINDMYAKLYAYMIKRQLQRPYITSVGAPIYIRCPNCVKPSI